MPLTRKEIQQRYNEKHRAEIAARAVARRAAWKATGLCSECGQPRDSATLTCAKCKAISKRSAAAKSESRKTRDLARRANHRAAGLCVQCTANPMPATAGTLMCDKHREQANARCRSFHAAHPGRLMSYQTKYKFGISMASKMDMLKAQGGTCYVCGGSDPRGPGWCLDHDHAFHSRDKRGHRGIACNACNIILGLARDNPAHLDACAAALRRWVERKLHAA